MASQAQPPLWRETVKAGAVRSGALLGAGWSAAALRGVDGAAGARAELEVVEGRRSMRNGGR